MAYFIAYFEYSILNKRYQSSFWQFCIYNFPYRWHHRLYTICSWYDRKHHWHFRIHH